MSSKILLYHHQYTNPPSALGFWIPLERCTPSNGALSFAPGTHLTSPISKRFVRLSNGRTGMEKLCDALPPPSPEQYVLQECEPGDLVIIHGAVLHKSPKNTSDKTRYAYTFHMIESPPVSQQLSFQQGSGLLTTAVHPARGVRREELAAAYEGATVPAHPRDAKCNGESGCVRWNQEMAERVPRKRTWGRGGNEIGPFDVASYFYPVPAPRELVRRFDMIRFYRALERRISSVINRSQGPTVLAPCFPPA
jgi:hypothetical protein